MKRAVVLIIVYYIFFIINCNAQGISINNSGNQADASSILDISSTSQGMLIPRMTTAQRDGIIAPAQSLLIFNKTTNCFEAYVNNSWYTISCSQNHSDICQQMQLKLEIGCQYIPAFDVRQTKEGGYIMGGWKYIVCPTPPTNYQNVNMYLIKTDGNGAISWSKTYGGTGVDWGVNAFQTTDGGYMLAGFTQMNSFGNGANGYYLVKTDTSGGVTWSNTYSSGAEEVLGSAQQTKDGGYILAGCTNDIYNNSIYIVKVNGIGDLEWSKKFSKDNVHFDPNYFIKQTKDGGYVFSCGLSNVQTGSSDCYIIRTDANGNLLWSNTYGSNTDTEEASYIEETNDGGFIIVGYALLTLGPGSSNIYLVKINGSGNLIWSNTYGTFSYYYYRGINGQITNDGGYIITGTFQNNTVDPKEVGVILAKTDASGNFSWSKVYGRTIGNYSTPTSLQQTTDGGYIMGGLITDYNTFYLYVLKTDGNGDGGGCNLLNPQPVIQVNQNVNTVTKIINPTETIPLTVVTHVNTIVTPQSQSFTPLCSKCK